MTKEQVLQQIYRIQDTMSMPCMKNAGLRTDGVIGILTQIARMVAEIDSEEHLIKSDINFD